MANSATNDADGIDFEATSPSDYESDRLSLSADGEVVTIELAADVVYDRSFRFDLRRACRVVHAADPGVVVLAGEVDAFAIGGAEDASDDDFDALDAEQDLQATFDAFATLGAPVVAALRGDVSGYGLALALCADIRVGSESGTYGYPEVSQGRLPAAGVTQRLTSTVGQARAREFLLSGGAYDAETVADWGLLNYVVADDEVGERARSLAEEFAGRPTVAYECMKRAVRAATPTGEPEFGFGTMGGAGHSVLSPGDD